MVRLLLRHGADRARCDDAGRSVHSEAARDPAILAALAGQRAMRHAAATALVSLKRGVAPTRGMKKGHRGVARPQAGRVVTKRRVYCE